jgi:hypothetical protein
VKAAWCNKTVKAAEKRITSKNKDIGLDSAKDA